MKMKYVRLKSSETDPGLIIPDDVGMPYERLVQTAYSVFKQEPDKVTFALHYEANESSAVDKDIWNLGAFFSNTTAAAKPFYYVFTPIDESTSVQAGDSRATERRPPSPQAEVALPLNESPVKLEVVRTEAQLRRRVSQPTSQDTSPRTHKRPRVLSPNNSGSSGGRRAANLEAAARGPRHPQWTSGELQSPHFATLTRQAQAESWPGDTSGRTGCHLQASVTASNGHESGPAPTGTPEMEASASSSPLSSARSSVSPPEDGLFVSQSPTLKRSMKSVRAASTRANSLIIETIEKDHHNGPNANVIDARLEHGAPSRKDKGIEVTFHFENKMGYHPQLKFHPWTVTYPGDENLKGKEEELKRYIKDQLYRVWQRLTERQRQGIMSELEIFVYVSYLNTNSRVDMLDATNHHQLWQFLLANIKDSEAAKLSAAVTLHRKQDVEMKILNRLSPTSSEERGGDDDRNATTIEMAAGNAEQYHDGNGEEEHEGEGLGDDEDEDEGGSGDDSDNSSNAGED